MPERANNPFDPLVDSLARPSRNEFAQFLAEDSQFTSEEAQFRFDAPVTPPKQVPTTPTRPSILGEFPKGVGSGIRELVPTGAAAFAVGAQIFGAEETALSMAQFAQERGDEINARYPRTVEFEDAFSSPGNFARFSLRALGEQVPVITTIIAGGGVGGIIGRLVGRGALTVAEGMVGLSRFSAAAGGIGAATVLETGATEQELFGATGEVKALASFGAGIAKGALEAVVPLAFARSLGFFGASTGKNILDRSLAALENIATRKGRIAASAGLAGATEFTTELLQEAVDIAVRGFVDDNFDALDPSVRSRLLESGFTGALVGIILGGLGGVVMKPGAQRETPLKELEGEDEIVAPTPIDEFTEPVMPDEFADFLSDDKSSLNKPVPQIDRSEELYGPLEIYGPPIPPNLEPGNKVLPEGPAYNTDALPTEEFYDLIAVSRMKDDAVTSIEFLSQESAEKVASTYGRRNVNFFAVRKDVVKDNEKSALFEDLPSSINEISNARIDVSNVKDKSQVKKQKVNLDRLLQLRSSAMRELFLDDPHIVVSKAKLDLDVARAMYAGVLNQGLRVVPEEGLGFTALRAFDANEVKEISNLKTSALMAGGYDGTSVDDSPLNIAIAGITLTDTEKGLSSRDIVGDTEFFQFSQSGQIEKQQTRVFSINVAQLKARGGEVLSGAPRDIAWLRRALERAELAKNKPLNEIDFVRVISEASEEGFIRKASLKPGLSKTQKLKLLKAILEYSAAVLNDGPSLELRLLKLIQGGLRITSTLADTHILVAPPGVITSIAKEIPSSPTNTARLPYKQFDETLEQMMKYVNTLSPAFGPAINAETGEVYDPATQKEGTVVLIADKKVKSLPHTQRVNAKRMLNFMRAMMKYFNLSDQKLVIYYNSPNGQILSRMKVEGGGVFWGTSDSNVSFIGFNQSKLESRKTDREIANSGAHEFGHFLVSVRLVNAPIEIFQESQRSYNRALLKGSLGTMQDFGVAMTSSARIGTHWMEIDPNLAAILGIETFSGTGVSGLNSEYFFSFEEFIAEQLPRYMFEKGPRLTLVEKFFKNLGAEILELFKQASLLVGLSPKDFKPEVEVEKWLDSLHEQNSQPNAPINIASALSKTHQQSLEENAKVFPTAATPGTEVGGRIDHVLQSIGMPKEKRRTIKAGVDRHNWLMKWGYTLKQFISLNLHVDGLRLYGELTDAWHTRSIQIKARSDETIRKWRSLSRLTQDRFVKFLFALDAMVYLKEDEDPRQPTEQEIHEFAKKYQLTEDAMEVFRQIRKDFNDFISDVERVAIKDIRRTIRNVLTQDMRIAKVQKEFKELRARPYFPHSRFGDFVVVVKEQTGENTYKTAHMEQFRTKREALRAAESMQKTFTEEEGFFLRVDKIPEEAKPFQGLPSALLAHIKNLPGITPGQLKWIDNLTFELSPTQSFRKRLLKRKDIPGYSLDAMRSYANYFWHGSNYLARIEFQVPMQEAIDAVNAEASDPKFSKGKDVSGHRDIADFMLNHFNAIMNPAPDWAQLRSLAYIWWIGFVPASAALNLTQIPIVTLPYLSARYGDLKSMAALTHATKNLKRLYQFKTDDVSDSFIRALDRAIRDAVVDESFAMELAGTAEGSNLARIIPGTKIQRSLMQASHWASWLFGKSEQFNRRLTFAAAWDLATKQPDNKILQELKALNGLEYNKLTKEDGFTEQEALAYLAARDAVFSTQFQYSLHARARFMRGRKGVLFAFYSFIQNIAFFSTHDKGATRFWITMLFMGGLMGEPFAEDIASLAKLIARKVFGKEFDVEKEVRELVIELADGDISPDLILHGVSRTGFGISAAADLLGIPFPQFDMSASVSFGSMIPGVEPLGELNGTFERMFSKVSTDIAGAAYGPAINIMMAMMDSQLPVNDWKRWERAMPRALKNLARSTRLAIEGGERTRTDAKPPELEFDVSDPQELMELVAQTAGFASTRVSRFWDRETMKFEAEKFWTMRRGMLLKQFDRAMMSGSKDARIDMIAAIKRYNNEVAIPGFTISSQELRASRRERIRQRKLFELGVPKARRSIPLAKEIRKLHPEAELEVEDVSRMK